MQILNCTFIILIINFYNLLLRIEAQNLHDSKNSNPIILLNNGFVLGSEETTVELNKTFWAFRGIPYAEPPIGDLRFEAPLPVKNWNYILDATKDRSICVQGFLDVKGSEDCLFINVYVPKNSPSEIYLLPVMVWIYGGAFINGDSTYQSFGPDYFLEENVIIVTFNYRLGIFGFLSTEDQASPGNYGLKDQILALHWVQDNIIFFGGDPGKVTIFGESAGSASVSYLLQTPLTKGLYQRAILQSGTTLCLWTLARESRNVAFATGKLLNVNTTNSQTLVDGLRNVDYKHLQSVSTVTDLGGLILYNPVNGLIFAPTIDGVVLTNKSHELISQGNFNKVPLIVGFNSQEGIPFAEVVEYMRLYLVSYDIIPTRLVPIDLNLNNDEDKAMKQHVASLIKNHYFGLLGSVALSDENLVQYISDDQFVRPIHESVRIYSKFVPVYYYEFSYEGILGNANRTVKGVGHGEDLSYFWRNNNVNPPQNDVLTRRRLIRMWTNFAKKSNPTPNLDPLLQNIDWIPNLKLSSSLTYLDINNNLTIKFDPSKENILFWKNIYDYTGRPPYDTY